LPSAKAIAKAIKDGVKPKWVAVVPDYTEHNFEKWSAYLHHTLDGKLAGGYVFLVLDHGKVAVSGAEGWARAPWEKENPSLKWSLDTPMQLASVSKTITAVALLKLWEESQTTDHKFSLDDPFWPHIKKLCPTAHASVKRVTIRHLLAHQSGFLEIPSYNIPQDLEKLLNQPLAHKPGTFGQYQNFNYGLLHHVLEQIGNVRCTPYVKEHVLRPMGITKMDTHYNIGELACGYSKDDKVKQKRGHAWDMDAKDWAGPGGWFASASDLGRFLEGIRKHKVLSKATTEMMLKENLGWDSSEPGWAKGGLVGNGKGQQLGSRIDLFPDGVAAVFLVNCEVPSDEDFNATAWLRARGK
jgi:CubicO group peptidase (beta-lactamase class C family)